MLHTYNLLSYPLLTALNTSDQNTQSNLPSNMYETICLIQFAVRP